jgi:hypothetical protein
MGGNKRMGGTKNSVMLGLFVVSAVWGGYVSWELHKEVRSRQLRQAEGYPSYSDFSWSAWVCLGLVLAQKVFKVIFRDVASAMLVRQSRWHQQVWGAKVERCCDAVFKGSYYVVVTVWAYVILRDKPWVPSVLGGSGETRFCWTDGFPFQPLSDDITTLYLTVVGYHLSEVLLHIFEPHLPDFWDMLLHHTVACFLVSFSYVLNYVRIGSLVLVLHGATDIFIYASKVLVDTSCVRLKAASYLGLVGSYAYFRIYVFPMHVMRSAWIESVQQAKVETAWGFLNFALCVLLLLHMYWFGLIIKIGVTYRKTGVARDMVSNLSAMDVKENKKQ